VNLSVTDRCNLSCTHCSLQKGSQKITIEETFSLADALDSDGTIKTIICWGEPSMRKDIGQIKINPVNGQTAVRPFR
jgi:MoaA/NifB/PqqE/SkfB family radical SAM enzyme